MSKQTITERMKALKIGDSLEEFFTHKTAPYSFARHAGIKVKVRSAFFEGQPLYFCVTRIQNRKK